MDGRNSLGRRISLLNDDQPTWPMASLRHESLPIHSRTSSFASTPSSNSNPPTPLLVRSDSDDSRDSSNMQRTPSPLTPTLAYDDPTMVAQKLSEMMPYSSSAEQIVEYSVLYASQEGLAREKRALYATSTAPHLSGSPEGKARSLSQRSSGKCAPSQKNHYPCPLSKLYDCHDYFTTSGHAARHAKKHTGRKDAFCPECNKAFTRKDNMEQHRRTHQTGRKASKDHSIDGMSSKKAKVQLRRSKPLPIQAAAKDSSRSSSFAAPINNGNMTRRSSDYSYPDPSQAMSQQYSPAYSRTSAQHYTGSSGATYLNGLDTLAIAASEETLRYASGY